MKLAELVASLKETAKAVRVVAARPGVPHDEEQMLRDIAAVIQTLALEVRGGVER